MTNIYVSHFRKSYMCIYDFLELCKFCNNILIHCIRPLPHIMDVWDSILESISGEYIDDSMYNGSLLESVDTIPSPDSSLDELERSIIATLSGMVRDQLATSRTTQQPIVFVLPVPPPLTSSMPIEKPKTGPKKGRRRPAGPYFSTMTRLKVKKSKYKKSVTPTVFKHRSVFHLDATGRLSESSDVPMTSSPHKRYNLTHVHLGRIVKE